MIYEVSNNCSCICQGFDMTVIAMQFLALLSWQSPTQDPGTPFLRESRAVVPPLGPRPDNRTTPAPSEGAAEGAGPEPGAAGGAGRCSAPPPPGGRGETAATNGAGKRCGLCGGGYQRAQSVSSLLQGLGGTHRRREPSRLFLPPLAAGLTRRRGKTELN